VLELLIVAFIPIVNFARFFADKFGFGVVALEDTLLASEKFFIGLEHYEVLVVMNRAESVFVNHVGCFLDNSIRKLL